ncbi:DUF3549 family protein [Vibrio sp. SS-MA-C1-2]|uniref:DUF3549 family protein n=1 Tax=Vibrio sp. SS-MA-C1-2 TaxID=2908646 RepID=UPI001F19D49F|nr:DUF3549 family protein [Vibrio sp. SS-MA-C1-2]UJF18908.1 DUF3549 family protein [Vibrio sp. SS-MA-C1-2]
MDTINSFSSLLTQANCQFTLFDFGRKITPINHEQLTAIEQNKIPYPYPIQRHAQFALAFWNQGETPWIWFLRFPLDERGLLNQALTGDFLNYVMAAMGTDLSKEPSEEVKEQLANNPYTFKPSDDKLAMFNALLNQQLNQEPSQFYPAARQYLSGEVDWQQWQNIGLQGFADVCARLNQDNNATSVRKALSHLPNEPRYALLGCLEHITIPDKLAVRLTELFDQQLQQPEPDIFLLTAYVRALGSAKANYLQPLILQILNTPQLCHQEMFIAISGRAWLGLNESKVASQFLIKLAQSGNQNLFNQLFTDLVMLPELRMLLLSLVNHQPNPELIAAIKNLQKIATESGKQ